MPVNRVKEYTTSVTIGAVSNVFFNLFLIVLWGANGAALATVGSEFLVTASQMFMIRKTIKRRVMFREVWKYFLSGLVMFIVVSRICQVIQMTIANLILEVALGVIIYGLGLILLKAKILNKAIDIVKESRK
jgi:O-antigen/teichoic acid export membrane protein